MIGENKETLQSTSSAEKGILHSHAGLQYDTLDLQLVGDAALSLDSQAEAPVLSAPTPLAAQPTLVENLVEDTPTPVISGILPVSTPHLAQAPSTVTVPGHPPPMCNQH